MVSLRKITAVLMSVTVASLPMAAYSYETSDWSTSGTRTEIAQPGVTLPATTTAWKDYDREELYPKTVMTRQTVTMADGTKLAAYITLPADENGQAIQGQFPTLLVISDYNVPLGNLLPPKLGTFMGAADPYMVKRGYASVSFDGRGSGNSEGVWDAWGSSQGDYEQIIDWVAAQSWTNGNIGLRGVSDLSINALFAAETGHPAVKAVFALEPIGDAYRDTTFTGGNGNIFFITWWFTLTTLMNSLSVDAFSNPQQALPVVKDHLLNAMTKFQVPIMMKAIFGDKETVYDGAFWDTRSPISRIDNIKVPTFLVGAVHDLFQRGVPAMYEQLKDRVTTKMVILPGTHIEGAFMTTGLLKQPAGLPPFNHIELQWFDKYLMGMDSGAEDIPNTTQYMIGQDQMAVTSDWPAPEAEAERLYLHSNGSLKTKKQSLFGMPRTLFDVWYAGGCSPSSSQWSLGILGFIPIPCFETNNSAKLFNLLYETPVYESDYAFNGPIQADIWVSTTGVAGNVSVRVDDIDPSGKASPISNGLLNLKARAVDSSRSRTLDGQMIQPWHPFTESASKSVYPASVMKVQVEIFPTSAVIKAGHKLRIAVGPSNVPQGIATGIDGLLQMFPGLMTVYSDSMRPSSVVIPTVPASSYQPLAPLAAN
ncbi:MAG: CocE/NonD family hydrolase [Hahellaceae bacterium]|nr:CocE/NonD family hydrolase [Hahellaceae bacterium]